MKHLILMRHAKSSWDHPDLDDHARPLNERGKSGAAAMAGWLGAMKARPDHVIVSDAVRTSQTWDIIRRDMGISPDTEISRDYYLANPMRMMDAIKSAPDDAETIMLIGHQPGMSVLLERLADGSEPVSRQRAYQHFPTAATALLDVPVAAWGDVDFGNCVFARFASPKELASA